MATGTAVQTYHIGTGNREDLINVITNISQTMTPFLSRFGRTQASNKTHEWLTDTLTAPASNAKAEGETVSLSVRGGRTRVSNYTQILHTPVSVSLSQIGSDPAGVDDEMDYQLSKALKEHARDIEIALVTGTAASGASGTARKMNGVLPAVSTNNTTGTGTGNETLTETMLNDTLETIWLAGGLIGESVIFCSSGKKRLISAFTAGTTKFTEATDKKLTNTVSVYESDFGSFEVKIHRWFPTDTVAILTMEYFKTAWLKGGETSSRDLAVVADSKDAYVRSELTLEYRAENSSGKITQLS